MSDAPSPVNADLLANGRQLMREHPKLTEVEFRNLMLERFREADQGLQHDKRNLTASPGHGQADGIFALFLLPWTFFRWLGWRGRLARHGAEMDVVVRALRSEGYFAPVEPQNNRDSGWAEP